MQHKNVTFKSNILIVNNINSLKTYINDVECQKDVVVSKSKKIEDVPFGRKCSRIICRYQTL